ncbi:hypothetical protein KS2013_206 [Kangiella sediminilitoris]|uniref:AB hydrolase-1 domain-containing protein n=2 Tax=Kangiella sediminilitoris TaxID=1144748 RepID=A0A1B3B813_9GAMM|nr:hypothetical protein KS2013_206 [Kangiella sediminilitoris]
MVVLPLVVSVNIGLAKQQLPALPDSSRLEMVHDHQLHIRETTAVTRGPTLVLLSGPTDNWHSDSAWWVLAQNYLAQKYHTVLIDRAGQGWSEMIKLPSYSHFASDLSMLIKSDALNSSGEEVVIVAFASANLAVRQALQEEAVRQKVRGVVLIDPDVLTEFSIKHYTSETEKYRLEWDALEAFIQSGKYDSRVKAKLRDELKHVKEIIPEEFRQLMDWGYYDAIETIRSTREYQIHKFLETTAYLKDLNNAQAQPIPQSIPLIIIDTDFEAVYLKQLTDEAAKLSVAEWRKEGSAWYRSLTEKSHCGTYWAVETEEHLLMFSDPEVIEQAIEKLLTCSI